VTDTFRIARNPDPDSTSAKTTRKTRPGENRQLAREWAYGFLGAAAAYPDGLRPR
jgi:hypothetical protein